MSLRGCFAICRSWRPRPGRGMSLTWLRISPGPSNACPPTIRPAVTCGSSPRPSAPTSSSSLAIPPPCSSACGIGAGGMTVRRQPPTTTRPPAAGPQMGRPGADPGPIGWRPYSNPARGEATKNPGLHLAAVAVRPRFLWAAPSWPASAGTTTSSRAWRSTGRVGGSSAGRTTARCGSGMRPPAPSWPASAGTTTSSRAWRWTGRVGGSSAGHGTTRCGSGMQPPAPSGLPPRARPLRRERGVRPGGSADRQRVGRQDGADLGRGLWRRAGLPPRARRQGRERGLRP